MGSSADRRRQNSAAGGVQEARMTLRGTGYHTPGTPAAGPGPAPGGRCEALGRQRMAQKRTSRPIARKARADTSSCGVCRLSRAYEIRTTDPSSL